jgi:hypothetical protein
MLVDRPGDADPAGLGQRFEARCDIDPVAKNVVAIGDHVAEIDTNAKPDALLVRHIGLTVEHAALHLGGTAHCVDDDRKFRQQPVSGGFNDAAAMLGNLRSISSRRCALRRSSVPSSSAPISRE